MVSKSYFGVTKDLVERNIDLNYIINDMKEHKHRLLKFEVYDFYLRLWCKGLFRSLFFRIVNKTKRLPDNT